MRQVRELKKHPRVTCRPAAGLQIMQIVAANSQKSQCSQLLGEALKQEAGAVRQRFVP